MPAVEVKLDFSQFDGTAGEKYRAWKRELLNALARITDRRVAARARTTCSTPTWVEEQLVPLHSQVVQPSPKDATGMN